jgi:beta-lactamase class A
MTPSELPAVLADWAAQAGLPKAAVWLRCLTPESEFFGHTDDGRAIYPASMIKVPLAVATAIAEREGRIRWDQPVEVTAANLTVNDAPSPLDTLGYVSTPAELVDLMLSLSDNVATNMLIDLVGRERATADLAELGFPDTTIHRKLSGALPLIDDPDATGRNTHPAQNAAGLFFRLAHDKVPGAQRILAALGKQHWNTKLSRGLRAGDHFAHKTGDTDEVSHDGGILTLESGTRYIVVVYSELASTEDTDSRFASFMQILRPHLADA